VDSRLAAGEMRESPAWERGDSGRLWALRFVGQTVQQSTGMPLAA
jgi:hypothetical protein